MKKKQLQKNKPNINSKELHLLYTSLFPLDVKKWDGLLDLCKSNDIPKVYNNYSLSLKTSKGKEKTTKRNYYKNIEEMECASENN